MIARLRFPVPLWLWPDKKKATPGWKIFNVREILTIDTRLACCTRVVDHVSGTVTKKYRPPAAGRSPGYRGPVGSGLSDISLVDA
jgi:hypothetical protein